MPALVIAIGNPLRRDDGVAHLVKAPRVRQQSVLQLTPEISAELAPYRTVVFVDADVNAEQVRIEPVQDAPGHSSLTHASRPSEVVALARALFGFSGRAYTCHIPAHDFSAGEGLSLAAQSLASDAAREIIRIVASA
jgi:Ni,Fe-hydrogenase maturation factor